MKKKKSISRCIDIMCGFLQGHSYPPVGFSTSEIPVFAYTPPKI